MSQRFVMAVLVAAIGFFCVGHDTLNADLEPKGMAKPVADLRDYDGTFNGSPGTGTIGYSTLYRDNKDNGAYSGCNGEGCGGHPGVDIPVSLANVYATYDGTVVRAECNGSGWGGLVVIKSTSIYTGEWIYFTFAHLKEWYVSVNQGISTGQLIGKSGGDPNLDYCPGTSTGRHLHYQIDKDDGNTDPYHPANANIPDSSFAVANKTYNPIPFVMGGYRWTFWQNGNKEYWSVFNSSASGVIDGALWIDGMSDPFIRRWDNVSCGLAKPCSGKTSVEASIYTEVHLNLYNACLSNPAKIYFTTSSSGSWDEAKSVEYWPSFGAWDGHVNMAVNGNWSGIITGIRIDPAQNCNPSASDNTNFGNITIEHSITH